RRPPCSTFFTYTTLFRALGVSDCKQAIQDAHAAWEDWRNADAATRCGIVRRWYELMIRTKEELAHVMTLESGKPLHESLAEVDRSEEHTSELQSRENLVC